MVMCFAKSVTDPQPLMLDGISLSSVENFKCLGITINNQLKWENHVNEIVTKASMRLHILRILCRFGASVEDLKLIYVSLVRSTLEYSCVVWQGGLTEKLKTQIERISETGLADNISFLQLQ